MLKSLCYIFFFLILGELIKHLFDIPIAGNIIGMVLIFLALKTKLIKLCTVKPASDKLLKYMVVFFVPYGVGLMVHIDILKEQWPSITLVVTISTLLTLHITAYIQQKLEKK